MTTHDPYGWLVGSAGGRLLGYAASCALGAGVGWNIGRRAVRYIERRRALIELVDPHIRHPLLYAPGHLLPDNGFVWLSRFIAELDIPRPVRHDVEIEVIEATNPDDGHPFRARIITPVGAGRGASADGGAPNDRAAAPAASRSASRSAVLWAHGGGHLMGTPGFYDPHNARIASELDAVVIAPYYRKAHRHPFPADVDDCYAALRWLQEHGGQLGIDTQRIAVVGDSAGGGLAAGLVQRAFDDNHPVAFQGLVYPMLDHRTSDKDGAVGQFIWTANSNRGAWARYLGPGHLDAVLAPYASPGLREDLTGLPPTWIGVGELDLFCDEAAQYAARLHECGVRAELKVYPGAYHGFDHIVPDAPVSIQLIGDLIAALRGGGI